jgi:pimeloyl-ACP methyl ester carboxylesterase
MQIVATQGLLRIVIQIFPRTLMTANHKLLRNPQESGFPAVALPILLMHHQSIEMKNTTLGTLAGVAVALLIPLFASKGHKESRSRTFILIHGSWHSAWNWHRVKPMLESQGHTVFAIDLPGMGRDKTPVHLVTLEMSVKKITDIIDTIEGQVILVGHSKNGIMISQAAEYRPDKVEKLVYLAAYLVPNGKTQREYSLQDTHGVLKPYVVRDEAAHSTTLMSDIYKEGLYHDCDNAIVEMAKLILSDEPIVTGTTPLSLTESNFGRVPRYYIECTEDRAVTPFIQQKMYTELPCRKVYKMQTGHSPFFGQPEKLVEILEEIAAP